jgi:S-adenosylmethionine:tRNA ribosyltransferase-isomerase
MTLLRQSPATRFERPDDGTAPAPAEHRGVERDGVRLLVARPGRVTHTTFRDLAGQLDAGDLLVVNDSATVAGELDAELARSGARAKEPVVLHVATPLGGRIWVVELRSAPDASRAVLDAAVGDRVSSGTLSFTLLDGYPRLSSSPAGTGNRLWRAAACCDVAAHLAAHGRPIAYGYLDRDYPLSDYQTLFSHRPGSAEMPSAARPFTERLVTDLVARGVAVAPITLHTGLSSQEAGESPQPERFEVSRSSARRINAALAAGGRVVAVGTTSARAVESAVDGSGRVVARSGWTERVITPAEPPRVVRGLVTGWHDPQASHLLLVEAVAGPELTQRAYDEAVREGYLWHEFGDSALLLPS